MDQKILVIIAAVVVVAAAGGGAYYLLTKDNEPASDYTLLDSPDKIVKGLTIKETAKTKNTDLDLKLVVDSVEGNDVKVTTDTSMRMDVSVMYNLSLFVPEGPIFDFNYVTENSYQTLTITHDGNKHTINGKLGTDDNYEQYDSIVIEYNSSVISVNGKMVHYNKTATSTTTDTMELKTTDGVLGGDFKETEKSTSVIAKATFYDTVLDQFKYDASCFSPAPTAGEKEKYGNVQADTYLSTGTYTPDPMASPMAMKDVKIHVYAGYIISMAGTVDEADGHMTLKIYIA